MSATNSCENVVRAVVDEAMDEAIMAEANIVEVNDSSDEAISEPGSDTSADDFSDSVLTINYLTLSEANLLRISESGLDDLLIACKIPNDRGNLVRRRRQLLLQIVGHQDTLKTLEMQREDQENRAYAAMESDNEFKGLNENSTIYHLPSISHEAKISFSIMEFFILPDPELSVISEEALVALLAEFTVAPERRDMILARRSLMTRIYEVKEILKPLISKKEDQESSALELAKMDGHDQALHILGAL